MTRLFAVLGSLAGLANTTNGYRPLTKRGYPSLGSFAFGVFASELPLPLIAGQATVLAAVSRWLSPRARRLSWLISGLSWLGLAGLEYAGRTADKPLNAALDAEFGAGRRTDGNDLWKRPDPLVENIAKAPGVVRTLLAYRDYATDSDIPYGEYGSRNTLDVWRHRDLPRDGRAPVLLQVPGGAWMTGSKRGQAHPLMAHLVERGWVCVSINYRLSPRSTWPDHIIDVKRALAWTKAHIADYGGDPDWVAITGGSAGGHLTALTALTAGDPRFQPGFTGADTSVQAAVPFYGVYDFTGETALHPLQTPMLGAYVFKQSRRRSPDVYRDASPMTYITEDAPPFFVLHGNNDTLVPVEQGRAFAAALQAVSANPVVYAEMPLAQHAFDIFGSARAAHTATAVEQFLAEIYAKRSRPAA